MLFLVLTVALAMSSVGVAEAGYAYDYSFDFSQHPWYGSAQDLTEAADNAAANQSGYTSMAYYSAWASDIYNNIGTLNLLHIVTHAHAGAMMIPSTTHWPGTSDHVTALTSNINKTGNSFQLISGISDWQTVRDTKYISNASGSPIRIAVYVGCGTGADPAPGYYNLLYSSTGHAGMDFAGGFTGDPTFSTFIGERPPLTWSFKYWDALESGYNAWYSMTIARDYVYSAYSQYHGYETKNYAGNGNILL